MSGAGSVAVAWIADVAARSGLRYEPEADERWLRAWEPYTTLRTPLRYEHVLSSTGPVGSLTVARFVVTTTMPVGGVAHEVEASAWIAIVQDVRIEGRAAVSSDPGPVFAEPPELVSTPRRPTGDGTFDRVFAAFAPSDEELARAITPSLRKLLLTWRTPLHAELRPGGFVLAPVALGADPTSLAWMLRSVHLFGEKAAKSPTG